MNQIVFARELPVPPSRGVTAPSFEELADIAIKDLRAHGPSGIVCGPITTGGTGHQVLNLEVFNALIRGLQSQGEHIFTQIPYEFGLRHLVREWEERGNSGYCMPILEVFYARLFESGLIKKAWFIPGWQSSFGAQYERKKLGAEGASIIDLSREEIAFFMRQEYSQEHVEKVMVLVPAWQLPTF